MDVNKWSSELIDSLHKAVVDAGGKLYRAPTNDESNKGRWNNFSQRYIAEFNVPGHDKSTLEVIVRYDDIGIFSACSNDWDTEPVKFAFPLNKEFFTPVQWNVDKGIVRLYLSFKIPDKYLSVMKMEHTDTEFLLK